MQREADYEDHLQLVAHAVYITRRNALLVRCEGHHSVEAETDDAHEHLREVVDEELAHEPLEFSFVLVNLQPPRVPLVQESARAGPTVVSLVQRGLFVR